MIANRMPKRYLLLLIRSYVAASVSRICSRVGCSITLWARMQSSIISVISRNVICRFKNCRTASSFAALNTVGRDPPLLPAI